MQHSPLIRLIICTLLCAQFVSCRDDDNGTTPNVVVEQESTIKLRFYQNDTETRAEFETGLKWAFSFLGAKLEEGSWSAAVTWESPTTFQLDVNRLGFNKNALLQLELLMAQFRASEEYRVTGGIDAGRFVVSILNNPNHYYKIVGMPTQLNQFTQTASFLDKRAAILESAVAFKQRLIQLPSESSKINQIKYWAEELLGSITDSSHIVVENEVIDIMENGQLRFGIYDTLGRLINGADPNFSAAGKPVKCLWCHETEVQPGFAALTSIPGYYSPSEFDSIVNRNNLDLDFLRSQLSTEINFVDRSNHTEVEKLYFRYMEPSAQRLSLEWNMTQSEVETILVNISTHTHHEFPSFGDLYYRADVEPFSPYATLPSSSSIRETNENEPNLLP